MAKGTVETPDEVWQREETERAEKAREAANKEAIRRAGLTDEERRKEDAKNAAEAEKERLKLEGMTETERIEAVTKDEHLPPWQIRLSSGKLFDARAQAPLTLVLTDGTSAGGPDLEEAREFYFDYVVNRGQSKKEKAKPSGKHK